METAEVIRNRRSVREFTDEPVSKEQLDGLIEAATWAPSGLNNQPWRFMEIREPSLIEEISALTKYRGVVAGAKVLLAVFMDATAMYDRSKDLMSTGAAVQNILLAAHDMGLGACWLGEILARREEVERLLGIPEDLEFIALVALGKPVPRERTGVRHPVEQFIVTPPSRGRTP